MPGSNCSNCLSSGTPCTHVYVMEKKVRVVHDYVVNLGLIVNRNMDRRYKEFSSTKNNELNICFYQRIRISRSLHETQALVDSILSTSKPFVNKDSNKPASLPPAGPYINADVFCMEDDLDSFADKFNHLHLDHGVRHYGPSSALVFTRSIFALKQRIQGSSKRIPKKRPQFWHVYPWQAEKEDASPDYDFPEEDLLNELIDLYFTKFNFIFPILHRPLFEKSIKDNLHRQDRHFGAMVFALCAAASRYSDDARVFDDPAEQWSAGWKRCTCTA
ncbi:hypothetical protein MPER_11715, partial [Moniliophthora perniciosa FA553]